MFGRPGSQLVAVAVTAALTVGGPGVGAAWAAGSGAASTTGSRAVIPAGSIGTAKMALKAKKMALWRRTGMR